MLVRSTRLVAVLAVLGAALSQPAAVHATSTLQVTVTSTVDTGGDGKCSLQVAAAAVNAGAATADCPSVGSPTVSEIDFGLDSGTDPGYSSGVFTITLTGALQVTAPLKLDGTSQSEYVSSPVIHINQTGANQHTLDFEAGSDGSTIQGLMLTSNVSKVDLLVNGANGVTVRANYFDTDGSALAGNSVVGVDLSSSTNDVVGGLNAGDRNLFGNTGQYGVYIQNNGSSNNTVRGNYFGLAPDGVTSLTGQSTSGTAVVVNAAGGAIANTLIQGNVITKFGTGIWLYNGADSNTVAGNLIGLAADGSTPGGGANTGILVDASSSNAIGGTTAAKRNVIANYSEGIRVTSGSDNNVIEGNYIGTDASGEIGQGGTFGIYLLGGSGNLIGGTAAGAGNVIADSANGGIEVETGPTGTRILGNLIGTNKSGTSAIPNGDGIRVLDTSIMVGDSNTPGHNLISGNYDGLLIQNTPGTTVVGNWIGTSLDGSATIPNTYGVYLGSTSAQFKNNWFAGNFDGVYLNPTATTAATSSGNCFTGNTHDGVQSDNSGATAAFAGNWWAAASGPGPVGPGAGDSVSTNVDYSGFLTTAPAACSVLKDTSFETDANHDKKPDGWKLSHFDAATDKRDCKQHKAGKCSLELAGNGSQKTASQTFLRAGVGGDDLSFSLWSKANAVPVGSVYRLQVKFYNGSSLIGTKTMNFVPGTHGFQWVKGAFTAPGAYTKVVYTLTFKAASGTAWFDSAVLSWAP
jgi:hypothetical protein